MISFTCKPFSELSLTELYDLMALRQLVFVVEQDCPYLDADGQDAVAWHLLGYDENSKLLAYARLMPSGVSYPGYLSIGRVVNHPDTRGKGVGKQLMQEAIREVTRLFGKHSIKLSAQCYLIPFYERLGFQTIGDRYLEDGIPHIAMIRNAEL